MLSYRAWGWNSKVLLESEYRRLSTWVRTLARRARASNFAHSIATLSGATAIGAAIVMMASPLITRLYSPTEFGALGVYLSILGPALVVAALRYDFAIPYPSSEREAGAVLLVALSAILLTSIAFAIAIGVGLTIFASSLFASIPKELVWWLPIGMWTSASYAALSFWMVRRRDFATLGSTKIAQGTLQAASQVGLGLMQVGIHGLIVGQVLGSSAGLARLFRSIASEKPSPFQKTSIRALAATAREYRRFPLYSSPAALLDALTGAIPMVFMATHFGAAAAGLFTLVQRVLVPPFALLTVNLGQVVFGDLAERRRADPASLQAMFRRRVIQISLLGLLLVVPMLILVPLILPRVFGQRWADASIYFLILSPMIYAGLVSSPFGYAVDVLRRQDLHLIRDSVRILVMTGALVAATRTQTGWAQTLALISAAGVANGAIYLLISWYAINSHSRTIALAPSAIADVPAL